MLTLETISKTQEMNKQVELHVLEINEETFYKISNLHLMRPFMMNIVSDSNHWLFLMSNGGITAGRKNAEFALFPYYTDDKLAEMADLTGSKTILQLSEGANTLVWEPFSERFTGKFKISRNLYKNLCGNKVIFEEYNHDLGLTFSYEWNSSNIYGFVKKSKLENQSNVEYKIKILDGIQNIMPHGVGSFLQNNTSNLVDAYKRNELAKSFGLGIYSLSAHIVDKAEPSESLKANVVWSMGLTPDLFLLSSLQLNKFRHLENITEEQDVKGEKGAYFVQSSLQLKPNSSKQWQIIANVNQDHAGVSALMKFIQSEPQKEKIIQSDIDRGTQQLKKNIAEADGLQFTADPLKDARHFSNVLFNIMRGGIFDQHYQIEKRDFVKYMQNANAELIAAHSNFVQTLPAIFTKADLDLLIEQEQNADLIRLAKEYLPLRFSRRHGDPSRPWNKFTINTHDETDGSKILDYEGNWRDIFQNWEALAYSYPEFIEGMIFKFLNASTFDGYNPYRITKDGFDWETIEPDNPWSYIGYWGDHQIIYLLKFLEFAQQKDPNLLSSFFDKDYFVYANVPYKIKPYEKLLKDSKNTIEFDEEGDLEIRRKVKEIGSDGSLLNCSKSAIYHVNFIEKILATILSKTSNFIPEGGIWMNTQRPEWNDANNALVGNGISMVTLCYLRRFFSFMENMLTNPAIGQVHISAELKTFFDALLHALESHKEFTEIGFDDKQRKNLTDALGQAGSEYRETINKNGFSGEKSVFEIDALSKFVKVANRYFEQTIRVNRRNDNLYHAYNLLTIKDDRFEIDHLSEMLEGQVAAISSGLLSADEVVTLLDALRNSKLYRPDQNSYILYPNKDLPGFLNKNTLHADAVSKSSLLTQLVKDENRQLVLKDVNEAYHFNGNFHNAEDLKKALSDLEINNYAELVKKDREYVLQLFEETFNHKSFTGRSGTFFSYEGLGSIYWHMVSKLYLAVQEVASKAAQNSSSISNFEKLLHQFREIGDGIGIHKAPDHYGAFPTDAYSHTPIHRGAQQPGMTGQVKEDIIVRLAELGVRFDAGQLRFAPDLLPKTDFFSSNRFAEFIDIKGNVNKIHLEANMLGFTICQVPVLYQSGNSESIEVYYSNGNKEVIHALGLSDQISKEIFNRTGKIAQIKVMFSENRLTA